MARVTTPRPSRSALSWLLAAGALALAPAAHAEDEEVPPADFAAYQQRLELKCVADPAGRQADPTRYELGGFRYELDGARAVIRRTSARRKAGELRIGVLSSIKDDDKETRANVDEFVRRFREADVDMILSGGDTALDEHEVEAVLTRLASLQVPVLAIVGNAENRTAFNRAIRAIYPRHRNVINMDLVRSVDGDLLDIVSLPGYHDRKYAHQAGYCMYKSGDVEGLPALAKSLDGPVLLLAHGPPQQSGRGALDFVPEAGNVGDPELAAALASAAIPFGIFGHILEAGGHATDLSGKKEIKPLTWAENLYVNPGSANSLPWKMNDETSSRGLAAIVTVSGNKARFEVLKAPGRTAAKE